MLTTRGTTEKSAGHDEMGRYVKLTYDRLQASGPVLGALGIGQRPISAHILRCPSSGFLGPIAAVIGVPDEPWGEEVKAFVVPASGQAPDEAVLKSLVKNKLGSVQAHKSIEFVEALPLTAVGKVDKKELRKAYWSDQERQIG